MEGARRILRPRSRLLGLLAAAASSLLLVACGTYYHETDYVDVTSAFQISTRDIEQVDLPWLLTKYAPDVSMARDGCSDLSKFNPDTAPNGLTAKSDAIQSEIDAAAAKAEEVRLDQALAFFNCVIEKTPEPQKKIARNALQERLLFASQQRCNAFKGNLQRTQSRVNFGLGVAGTAAGTAGALFSSITAARVFSGASAIFSGTRAEFNQDYMANLAVNVIIDGLDRRREEIYDQIQKSGQSKKYEAYPVEAAIKDAFFYHGACSIMAGFQEAAAAIKVINDPGLNAAFLTIAKIKTTAQIIDSKNLSPQVVQATANQFSSMTPLIAGSALEESGGAGEYFEKYQRAVQEIDTLTSQMKDDIKGMADEATKNGKPDAVISGLMAAGGVIAPEPEGMTGPLASDVKGKCSKTIQSYFSSESLDRENAAMESDPAKKLDLQAEIASTHTKGDAIAQAMTALADKYATDVATARSSWVALFTKAKAGDATATTGLANALHTLPSPDTAMLQNLQSICNPH
jgi:hypothetical protein